MIADRNTINPAVAAAMYCAKIRAHTPHVVIDGYLTEHQAKRLFKKLCLDLCLPSSLGIEMAKQWCELERTFSTKLDILEYDGVKVIYYPAQTILSYIHWIFESQSGSGQYKTFSRLSETIKFKVANNFAKMTSELLAYDEDGWARLVINWQRGQLDENMTRRRPY